MGQVGSKLRRIGPHSDGVGGGYAHWCPACEELHAFATDNALRNGARWTWDGNIEAPTFRPSMHIKTNPPDDPDYQPDAGSSVCHYNLVAGTIEFCGDCTHAMVGQRVPLPDLPLQLTDRYLGPDK